MARPNREDGLRWNLLLDESGDFAGDERVAVAGLLVPADHPHAFASRLAERLRQAAPDLPWPFKASELNQPILFALAAKAARRNLPGSVPELLQHLEEVEPTRLQRVVKRLEEHERPEYEDLAALNRIASGRQPAYERVADMAAKARAEIQRCLRDLARPGTERGPGALLVACGETVGQEIGDETSRYLELLHWVLQRAADILSRCEGKHTVEVTVLERNVDDTVLATPVRTRLHFRHVNPLVAQVNKRVRGPVKLLAAGVRPYNREMHAALVLADLVANRARYALGRPDGLAMVEAALVSEICCPARSGQPPLSHVAAAGRAQERIEQARAGKDPEDAGPWQPDARRWAMEQAEQWVEAFRR